MTKATALVVIGLICSILLGCSTSSVTQAQVDEAQTAQNRLKGSGSPYLRMHADNPVAWYPWGEEAFRRAKQENRPIFLSIGYSSCYWCHVMERETFQDEEIARILNRHFVCIKVDREQRPDVDEVYLTAVQVLTGQAGWPLSVFLTPDGKPFFGGTYFPPVDRDGMPGFRTILKRIVELWETRRQEVLRFADQTMRTVRLQLEGLSAPALVLPDRSLVDSTVTALRAAFDPAYGGFGNPERRFEGPKFPQAPRLLFLAFAARRGNAEARKMLAVTLEHLLAGGVYDHLGGGFHRYATDRRWQVPHFEKMLYDNGLLLSVLSAARGILDSDRIDDAIRGTVWFLSEELRSSEGGFYSSLGAESNGREGAYYLWTRAELEKLLTPPEFRLFSAVYGLDGVPQVDGAYVLRRVRGLDAVAHEEGLGLDQARGLLGGAMRKLVEARRRRRERPPLDDKIIAAWNGLAIVGLADVARVTGDRRALELAEGAARHVLRHLWVEGEGLYRTRSPFGDDVPGTLDDYVFLAWGLVRLAEASGDSRWSVRARRLLDEALVRFWEPRRGRFWLIADESRLLPVRPASLGDGAVPAGSSVAVDLLVEFAVREREPRYAEFALSAVKGAAAYLRLAPQAQPLLVRAWARYLDAGLRVDGRGVDGKEPVSVRVEFKKSARGAAQQRGADTDVVLLVRFSIADGWYLHAPSSDTELGVPVDVRVRVPRGYRLVAVHYPEAEEMVSDGPGAGPVWMGEKAVEIRIARVGAAPGGASPADSDAVADVVVVYQACTEDRCAAPVRREFSVRLGQER